jgi:hypothetical protein
MLIKIYLSVYFFLNLLSAAPLNFRQKRSDEEPPPKCFKVEREDTETLTKFEVFIILRYKYIH